MELMHIILSLVTQDASHPYPPILDQKRIVPSGFGWNRLYACHKLCIGTPRLDTNKVTHTVTGNTDRT